MKVENLDIPDKLKESYIEEGIVELNPPQKMAVEKGLLDGNDLIIASPTASGKTFIAELGISKKAVEQGKTAIYIVPLKALASEKYEDFSERYENLKVNMTVGNSDDAGEYLENSDIVIATSEKMDSMLRHNPSWIHDIGLVVIDEIHLLTSENRGPTLEVTLTRLRELLDFQLLGLSATISNASEMADWLDSKLVKSDYRPVELKHGVYWNQEVEFFTGDEEIESKSELETPEGWSTGNEMKEKKDQASETEIEQLEHGEDRGTSNILKDTLKLDKQAITFCNSRKGSEKESDRAGKITENDLSREEKKQLEEYSEDILNALGSPTSQCKRLAKNIKNGAAFHHAGLCVSGDSVVMHSDGSFSRMDNLIENDKKSTFGLSNYSLTPNKILKKYEMDKKPVLKIKTARGRELKVSKNHQLPVLAERGIEWRKSRNLSKDDKIGVPRKIDVGSKTPEMRRLLREDVRTYRKYEDVDKLAEDVDTQELNQFREMYREDRNISVGGLRELCKHVGQDPDQYLDTVMSKAGQKPVKIPEKLDNDIAWLIGAVAGDGYIGSSEINLSGSEEKILERFSKIVSEKFDREISITERSRDDVKTYSFGSKAISDILYDHFGIARENKAENLRMPNVGMKNKHLASYIRGLFDTDGSVNCRENSNGSSCIEFYTASDRLATELHTSLLRFGINAYRDKRKTEGRETEIRDHTIKTNGDVHRLNIYGSKQLRKYQRNIGFTHPEKKADLEKALEVNPEIGRKQNDVIPKALGARIREERNSQDLSLSDLEPELSKATISRFENHETPMKRSTFQKLAEELNNEDLRKIANSDIFWDKVTEIEEKEPEKLYDISTSTDNFIANGIIAHNTTEQRKLVEDAFKKGLIRNISATPTLAAGINLPAYRVIIRDLKRYTGEGMDFIPVLEYEQMTGRAGRPKYDNEGQAISIAKQPGMKQDILERYILGEAERIQSKLNVEPVLRMHTLALIASKFCASIDELLDFYSETFYAHQFGDMSSVKEKITRVVETLDSYDFVNSEEFEPTKIGRKVSDLYIDPDSAHLILKGLSRAEGSETRDISYLFMLSRTSELNPKLRVKDKEWSDYETMLMDAEHYLLEEIPQEWDSDYEIFMNSMKTAMMMNAWISEMEEEKIMDEFGIAPGGIRAKMQNADWLLYSSKELARMKGLDVEKDLERLRIRLKHGIDEELLNLVKYDQIGRVRARKLHDYGIRNKRDIKEVGFEKLKKLIGKKTAGLLKEQVGEENYFDRENIMDYFE